MGLLLKLSAEFTGTFLLLSTIQVNSMTILSESTSIFTPLSIALTLLVSIYAFGNISGAQFNPSVSVALSLAQKQSWDQTFSYIAAQIMGSICSVKVFSNGNIGNTNSSRLALFLGPPGTTSGGKSSSSQSSSISSSSNSSLASLGFSEMFSTFFLCFIVLHVACARRNKGNQFYGVAIACVVFSTALSPLGSTFSGAIMNPAVAVGIDYNNSTNNLNNNASWSWSPIYICFQIIGSALASGLYKALHPLEFGEASSGSNLERLLGEFSGTFFLTMMVGVNMMGMTMNLSNSTSNSNSTDLLTSSLLSISSCLCALVYALGSLSGAHFNPSVSVGLVLSGKLSQDDGLQYITSQLMGSISGCFVVNRCFYPNISNYEQQLFAPKIIGNNNNNIFELGIFEFFSTFLLVHIILNAVHTLPQLSGIAVSATLLVSSFLANVAGGGCLNPAIALGSHIYRAIVIGLNSYSNSSNGSGSLFSNTFGSNNNSTTVSLILNGLYNGLMFSFFEVMGAVVASIVHYQIRKARLKGE